MQLEALENVGPKLRIGHYDLISHTQSITWRRTAIKMFFIAMKWHKRKRTSVDMCTSFIVQVMKSAQQLSRRDVTSRRSAFALSHRFVSTLDGVIQRDARRRYLICFFPPILLLLLSLLVCLPDVAQISASFSNGSISHRRTHLFSAHTFFFTLFI